MKRFFENSREAIGTRGYTEEAAERGQRAVDLREASFDARRYDDITARLRAGEHVTKAELQWAKWHKAALKRG